MNYLYALDAKTGKPVLDFGEAGRIDLRKGLGGDYRQQSIALTSPGVIFRNLIIVGGRNPEAPPAPPGYIRAFNVRTGELVWTFHTIPHPGEPGYETWPVNAWESAGAANNWAGMAVDESRGTVYVPTGSAVPDFYGGARVGDDKFANCLLALDAATGKLLWSFQGVHHDLWDRDFPAPPALLTVKRNGKRVEAIAQTTKQGFLFVLDRDTGKPLFQVEERPVVVSSVPGEVSSRTQPVPLLPAPYARQTLTIDDLTYRTPEVHADAVKQFKTFISGESQFYPLTVDKQTITMPGYDGGAEWGGPAVDRPRGVIYVNTNDVADTGGLAPNNPTAGLGASTYREQCALCHQDNRGGSPPEYPSLLEIDKRLTAQQMIDTIHAGKGRMPPFPNLQDRQLAALLDYLRTGKESSPASNATTSEAKKSAKDTEPRDDETTSVPPEVAEMNRYRFTGYHKFQDLEGYPASAPPWGTLNAIDLNTGKYLWKIPLGYYPELAAKGMANTGTENYGGPIVTAGGLLIIGATVFDKKIRAFDSRSGALLWEYQLPFSSVATPTTYMVDGKQYIVVAAGGSKLTHGAPDGLYIAFALP
jgi:quinoprotein glucose dehydrogenase